MARVDLDGADIVAALRAAGARFGYLHGSRNEETSRSTSDVDVAAWFGPHPPASWEVALPGNVDLLVLDTAPLYLAGRVALYGRLLFEDEPAAHTADRGGLAEDPIRLRAVKYGFVTAIEGCTRAAQHVISSAALGMPQSNADSLRLLGKNVVIEAELAEAMARAVGFGNVLVHEYVDVDDSVVVANLGLLSDLDDFVVQLAGWAAEK